MWLGKFESFVDVKFSSWYVQLFRKFCRDKNRIWNILDDGENFYSAQFVREKTSANWKNIWRNHLFHFLSEKSFTRRQFQLYKNSLRATYKNFPAANFHPRKLSTHENFFTHELSSSQTFHLQKLLHSPTFILANFPTRETFPPHETSLLTKFPTYKTFPTRKLFPLANFPARNFFRKWNVENNKNFLIAQTKLFSVGKIISLSKLSQSTIRNCFPHK